MDARFRRRPTQLHIDLDAIRNNYRELDRVVAAAADSPRKPQIMAVIKAEAYGHGLLPVAEALAQAGVESFGVALLEEGIRLRQAGIEGPILVMGGHAGEQVRHFLDYHLDLTASSQFKLNTIDEAAARLGRRARIHLKVDTGMKRIGVRPGSALPIIRDALQREHVELAGLYTHFAQAESPNEAPTLGQIAAFDGVVETMRAEELAIPPLHLCNTAALLRFPNAHRDVVRPGIGLFGVAPAPEQALPCRPAMRLETEVVYIKGIRCGEGVGYGHSWHAPKDGWLATIPIGYGDGYPRRLSNRAEVLIQGRRRPVVGQISMDQATVWLEDEACEIGEAVVLLGRQGDDEINAWELARWCDSIAYEVLCGWSERIPRIYHR